MAVAPNHKREKRKTEEMPGSADLAGNRRTCQPETELERKK